MIKVGGGGFLTYSLAAVVFYFLSYFTYSILSVLPVESHTYRHVVQEKQRILIFLLESNLVLLAKKLYIKKEQNAGENKCLHYTFMYVKDTVAVTSPFDLNYPEFDPSQGRF